MIEIVLTVAVVAICLWGLLRFLLFSHRSLIMSEAALNAQSSAEDLFQQIRLSKWDNGSQPGQIMDISIPPYPTLTPLNVPPQAIEDWNGYTDVDSTRPAFGPFTRRVSVQFVHDVGGVMVPVGVPSDRKRVIVRAESPVSSSTVSGIFCNLP